MHWTCPPRSANVNAQHFLLSTEWVDYVEEPMKYQALRPHFFSMVGGWGWWGRGDGMGGGWVGWWWGMGGGGVGVMGKVVVVCVGFGVHGVLVRDVVGDGGAMGGGMGDGGEEGGLWCGWCAGKF